MKGMFRLALSAYVLVVGTSARALGLQENAVVSTRVSYDRRGDGRASGPDSRPVCGPIGRPRARTAAVRQLGRGGNPGDRGARAVAGANGEHRRVPGHGRERDE